MPLIFNFEAMKKFFPYILAATMLIAGFFIGTFTAGRITRNKIERFSSYRSPDNFRQMLYRDLNLTPEQQKKVDPIIREHSKTLRSMTMEYKSAFTKELDQFHAQLEPVLTDDQKKKMEEKRDQFRKGYQKDRQRRHPGDRREGNRDRHHDGPPPPGMPPMD